MPASPFFAAAALVVSVASPFFVGSALAQTPALPISAASAKADTLSIGPGLFTFPQIAALLSTKEQVIACDVSLKDRAAFVYLVNRPRDEVVQLLGAGLQVEFTPPETPAGVTILRGEAAQKSEQIPPALTMFRQKAVAAREAAWLKQLARILQTEVQNETARVLSYDGKPLPNMKSLTTYKSRIAKSPTKSGNRPTNRRPQLTPSRRNAPD